MAARRVADENKKLRGLLAQHGIGDDNIDAFLQTSPVSDTMMNGQFGSSSGAVQALEQLLQTRKTCCVDGSNPMVSTIGGGSRDSSASVTTVQSLWDPIYSQNTGGRRRSTTLQPTGKAASSAQQFMTPSTSIASRTSSASMGHRSHRVVPHHPRLAPVQMARNPSPASNPPPQHQQMFDFDTQLSNPSSYASVQSTAQKHLQPHNAPQRSSVYIPTTTSSNVNNCNYATDLITTMAGVDPSTVRADLGCLPGMECDVDNHLVFNVMDRYTQRVEL